VHVRHAEPDALEQDVERMRVLARLLDTQFEIAGIRFGWDAIVGLVPVVGDVATVLVGLYPVLLARKHGLGGGVQAKMAANLLVDFVAGSVPLVGDLLDVVLKANARNLRILERAVEQRRSQGLL
jgi:hypothetical protein